MPDRVKCASCLILRPHDQLSECPFCGEYVCGINKCTGDCACSTVTVVKKEEDDITLLTSGFCPRGNDCAQCDKLSYSIRNSAGQYIKAEHSYDWLGMTPAELVGKTITDVLGEGTKPALRSQNHFQRVMDSGETLEVVDEYPSCVGMKRTWLIRYVRVETAGRQYMVTFACNDVVRGNVVSVRTMSTYTLMHSIGHGVT